jgi:hypothetical protein
MPGVSKVVVIVTGGRDYANESFMKEELLGYDPSIVIIRHGAASGADTLAGRVATELGFEVQPIPADWSGPCGIDCRKGHRRKRGNGSDYCPAAGPRRNKLMLDLGADVVHAFPGGTGTKDMIRQARERGIPTVGWDPFEGKAA